LPLPFLWFLAAKTSAVAFGTDGPWASGPGTTLGVVGGLVPTLLGGLCFAPSRALRGVAYFGYVLCLTLGFGLGSMLSVKDLAQRSLGEVGGSGVMWLLLFGSFVCAASLLPVIYLIVSDWRSSRRAEDLTRP